MEEEEDKQLMGETVLQGMCGWHPRPPLCGDRLQQVRPQEDQLLHARKSVHQNAAEVPLQFHCFGSSEQAPY